VVSLEFFIVLIFRPYYEPKLDLVPKNDYQGYLLEIKAAGTLPPSDAYCLDIVVASTSCGPKALSRPVQG